MLRILVVDEAHALGDVAGARLSDEGYEVIGVIDDAHHLVDEVARLQPDVILIRTDSPSRDTLEHLAVMDEKFPRPVVMMADEQDSKAIRAAVGVGVTAYLAEKHDLAGITPVLEMACASFDRYQSLRRDFDESNRKLAERKNIDRAKGLLMQARGMKEEEAYHAMRKLAMQRGKTLNAVALDVIGMADFLT